jgi:peptidoglycan/xylan/chitin deacetylase (PgdA/CDA1 family)
MKSLAKKAILGTRTLRLAASLRENSVVILMYHSVLPDPSTEINSLGEMIHSADVFLGQMELLARDYHPISLDEAVHGLRDGNALTKRSVVVTFDDGYTDNYEIAMPMLNQAGIPATFYTTVDCIDSRKLPWPARLRFAIRSTKARDWTPPDEKRLPLETPAQRDEAFREACGSLSKLSGQAQESFVSRLEQDLKASLPNHSAALMMNYDQLRALARHKHIVASHTMTHPNIAFIGEEECRRELTESKRRLESELGAPIKHFAYPCPALSPHWTTRTLEQCRAAGYETAVTTDHGLAHKGDDLLCLKRIPASFTVEGLRWDLESAFAGRAV